MLSGAFGGLYAYGLNNNVLLDLCGFYGNSKKVGINMESLPPEVARMIKQAAAQGPPPPQIALINCSLGKQNDDDEVEHVAIVPLPQVPSEGDIIKVHNVASSLPNGAPAIYRVREIGYESVSMPPNNQPVGNIELKVMVLVEQLGTTVG